MVQSEYTQTIKLKTMIQKFRKKPVVIEAVQYDGNNESEIQIFSNGEVRGMHIPFSPSAPNRDRFPEKMTVKTLEGELTVSKDDWVIKGVNGEFYPCKPDIFEKTYELVKEKILNSGESEDKLMDIRFWMSKTNKMIGNDGHPMTIEEFRKDIIQKHPSCICVIKGEDKGILLWITDQVYPSHETVFVCRGEKYNLNNKVGLTWEEFHNEVWAAGVEDVRY